MPKILKRNHREKRQEKKTPIIWKHGRDHLALSDPGSRILDPGSSSPPISVQFSIKLFPFYVDGFEARDGKLVYNELKMSSSHIKFQITWKFY